MIQTAFDPHHSALFTDLYELTMLQAYYAEEMNASAVFELFFRAMPKHRNYVMAAGIDEVLYYLENLHFTDDDLDWLREQGLISDACLETLRDFRFTGDVYAVPEGTVMFANEPVVQVVAPLPQAQLVETFILNQIHLQSVVATKAARVVSAAQGGNVVDFGSRRSHGTDAALKVARCSYLAGAAGTSNVAASRLYGMPVFGTMAHSYIQAHPNESSAFKAFAEEFPGTTLLVDTYDTLDGLRTVIEMSRQLGERFRIRAIRLDSGDLVELAKGARKLLDAAGLAEVKIIASSSLDEYKITALLEAGAPIDGFGVGTEMAVSGDAPVIDFSYKLVAYDGQPRMKLSSSKINLPGRKQVFRVIEQGQMRYDTLTRFEESAEGEPLLRPVMENGRRVAANQATLEQARKHAKSQLDSLPAELQALQKADKGYLVGTSAALTELAESLQRELEGKMISSP